MSTPPEERPRLDLAGLKCPLPVLKIRRALLDLPRGAVLEAYATDPLSAVDVPALVQELGLVLLSQQALEQGHVFQIRKP